jgi:hypothetical protein
MPIISTGFNTLAPGATVAWEIPFAPNNQFLPVPVPIVKPFLAVGNAGVFLGVSNIRTTIDVIGGLPAYSVLVDVTNQASVGGPIVYELVVGFAQ